VKGELFSFPIWHIILKYNAAFYIANP